MGAWIEICYCSILQCPICVAPPVGAWIEIWRKRSLSPPPGVAPPVGAWIEISAMPITALIASSLPPWERGLKLKLPRSQNNAPEVAPPVGAWIEIPYICIPCSEVSVAPPVGAWIEIFNCSSRFFTLSSLPPWERGLKFFLQEKGSERNRRSPRGSVD